MKIIIDAMGGDLAPQAPVRGGLQAAKEFGVEVLFTGNEAAIRHVMKQDGYDELPAGVEIVNCTEVVDNCDDPSIVWRKKPDSSMTVGLKLLKASRGNAFISAGSTGALLSGATLLVRRIRGVKRAAVAPSLPTGRGRAVLIDAGANSECTVEQLVQFAVMGAHYAELVLGIKNPRVGLLNIGAEPSKGTELYQETWKQLDQLKAEQKLNFIGNVEGRNAVEGDADVIVADGFTGNIFLKTMEGTAGYITKEIKRLFLKNTRTKAAALMVKGEIADFRRKFDYREVGGTALLGIAKPVIKAHGSSDAFAFRSAVKQAVSYAEGRVTQRIESQLAAEAAVQTTLKEVE